MLGSYSIFYSSPVGFFLSKFALFLHFRPDSQFREYSTKEVRIEMRKVLWTQYIYQDSKLLAGFMQLYILFLPVWSGAEIKFKLDHLSRLYTGSFQSIEIGKKFSWTFDNVFHVYLMSGLKKNAKFFFSRWLFF